MPASFTCKLGGEKETADVRVCVSLRFDQEPSPENRLYLDCFCVVARGIGVSHVYTTMATGCFDACLSLGT